MRDKGSGIQAFRPDWPAHGRRLVTQKIQVATVVIDQLLIRAPGCGNPGFCLPLNILSLLLILKINLEFLCAVACVILLSQSIKLTMRKV
jgi:hypothetical protein